MMAASSYFSNRFLFSHPSSPTTLSFATTNAVLSRNYASVTLQIFRRRFIFLEYVQRTNFLSVGTRQQISPYTTPTKVVVPGMHRAWEKKENPIKKYKTNTHISTLVTKFPNSRVRTFSRKKFTNCEISQCPFKNVLIQIIDKTFEFVELLFVTSQNKIRLPRYGKLRKTNKIKI